MRPLCLGDGPLILGGDVGGTKIWLGLFRASGRDANAGLSPLRSAKYPSKSAGSLEQLVGEFLGNELFSVEFACFVCPAPCAGRAFS